MKIIVIGAVAAGTSAAAKARRNNEQAEITIYEKDRDISYSGCGLPYYIGKVIEKRSKITPRDVDFFKNKYNVNIKIGMEVIDIDTIKQIVTIKDYQTNTVFEDSYDKLVISTGARSRQLQIDSAKADHVFTLRNVDSADKIKNYIESNQVTDAVIVGTGFIALELLENLIELGITVNLVEKANQINPIYDYDFAKHIQSYLEGKKINITLNDEISNIDKGEVSLVSGKKLKAQIVIVAIGVIPNIELAKTAKIDIGEYAIKVNNKMETSIKNIYACGDCIETYDLITMKPCYVPLGSTANKTGRIAGDQISGGNLEFRGILKTSIFRVFDLAVASTGLTEREALRNGYDVVVCHNIKPSRAAYAGGKELMIKAIADRKTHRLLGAQILGEDGVDKRIDVIVALITYSAKVEDLFHLDLAYSPIFSTTKDPIMYTGMILTNIIDRNNILIKPENLGELDNPIIIDARSNQQYNQEHVEQAVNIPHDEFRSRINEIDPSRCIVTYCNKGVTGNAVLNILKNRGYLKVYSLSGGYRNYAINKNIK